MKDSIKANLLIFILIAIISFAISTTVASLTITENNDSYKLVTIENDSFQPAEIDKVPIYVPPVKQNNTTNITNITNTTNITNITTNITNITTNITETNETTNESYNNTIKKYWDE